MTTPPSSVTVTHCAAPEAELSPPVRNAREACPGSSRRVHVCPFCGNHYEGTNRPSSYCGATCQQNAFRACRQQPVVMPMPRRTHALGVLYECSGCGERLLNEQRCEACSRFARRLGVALTCPACDEPILLAELLE